MYSGCNYDYWFLFKFILISTYSNYPQGQTTHGSAQLLSPVIKKLLFIFKLNSWKLRFRWCRRCCLNFKLRSLLYNNCCLLAKRFSLLDPYWYLRFRLWNLWRLCRFLNYSFNLWLIWWLYLCFKLKHISDDLGVSIRLWKCKKYNVVIIFKFYFKHKSIVIKYPLLFQSCLRSCIYTCVWNSPREITMFVVALRFLCLTSKKLFNLFILIWICTSSENILLAPSNRSLYELELGWTDSFPLLTTT